MIIGKVFDPDFFVYSITYNNGRKVTNGNNVFSSTLQLGGKAQQVKMIVASKREENTNESPLPSLKYLESNPLTNGKYTLEEMLNNKPIAEELDPDEVHLASEGLLLPKSLILIHKLGPLSLDGFIESMSDCIKRMYDIQRDEYKNLKQNIPHYHILNGFTIEGVLAVQENRSKEIFVPFSGHRLHFSEEMVARLLDGLSDSLNDDLFSVQSTEWLRQLMLPFFEPVLTCKFHFFAAVQIVGQFSMSKKDSSSSFDKILSPLQKLNTELGFKLSKL